jgi:hypothetical protein
VGGGPASSTALAPLANVERHRCPGRYGNRTECKPRREPLTGSRQQRASGIRGSRATRTWVEVAARARTGCQQLPALRAEPNVRNGDRLTDAIQPLHGCERGVRHDVRHRVLEPLSLHEQKAGRNRLFCIRCSRRVVSVGGVGIPFACRSRELIDNPGAGRCGCGRAHRLVCAGHSPYCVAPCPQVSSRAGRPVVPYTKRLAVRACRRPLSSSCIRRSLRSRVGLTEVGWVADHRL